MRFSVRTWWISVRRPSICSGEDVVDLHVSRGVQACSKKPKATGDIDGEFDGVQACSKKEGGEYADCGALPPLKGELDRSNAHLCAVLLLSSTSVH